MSSRTALSRPSRVERKALSIDLGHMSDIVTGVRSLIGLTVFAFEMRGFSLRQVKLKAWCIEVDGLSQQVPGIGLVTTIHRSHSAVKKNLTVGRSI